MEESIEESWDGGLWCFIEHCTFVLDEYGLELWESCLRWLSIAYTYCTFWNVTYLLLKFMPMGLYAGTVKQAKSTYNTSRERIKQKQMTLEDIQLQVQIVNTKMSVWDAESSERAEERRRKGERLRAARARVRVALAADGALGRALARAAPWADEPTQARASPEEERELMSLLRELKTDPLAIPEAPTDMMECGEHVLNGNSSDNSIYSSLSDAENKDCLSVKIVKVTNVYKVAYLNHYIKQKRLRRATKHALLKKKNESIKKLFEDWQTSLNMATNTKLSMLDTNQFDMSSQEVMGDYSRPNLRDSSDSDSDMRANGTDAFYDEYSLSWTQNPCRSYPYTYDGIPDIAATKEFYDSQDFNETRNHPSIGCNGPNVLFILPEETSSQIAIEDTRSDHSSSGELEQDS